MSHPDLLLDTVPMIRPATAPSDFIERAQAAGAAASRAFEWFRSVHGSERQAS